MIDRRAFLRLVGLGVALGPEAIAEAMKPRIYYSIPKAVPTLPPWSYYDVSAAWRVIRVPRTDQVPGLIGIGPSRDEAAEDFAAQWRIRRGR